MKKNLTLLFFAILFNLPLFAQSNKVTAVSEAVDKLKNSMITPKKDALYKMTVPELSYGHSSGLIENREEFVNALVSGKSDFKSIALTDQTIEVVGNTAYVRHKLAADVVDSGNAASINLGVLLVWIEQDGQWKLLARQAFKL